LQLLEDQYNPLNFTTERFGDSADFVRQLTAVVAQVYEHETDHPVGWACYIHVDLGVQLITQCDLAAQGRLKVVRRFLKI
jgi:hypothetical protein